MDSLWWLLVLLSVPALGLEVVESLFRSLEVLVVVVGGAGTSAGAACTIIGAGGAGT
ncbi:MAG: hypothetical protein ABSD31_18805 [Candidatus Binataceae bacterium]